MSNFCVYDCGLPDGPTLICGNKVENRDLGLCATHNRLRLKSERPAPEPKERKGLKPGKPLSNGSTIPQKSAKQSSADKEIKKAYDEVDKGPHICESCGETQGLTHSHVLSRGQFKKHEANPRNILLECVECHHTWEHDKRVAKATHASWALKMEIWEELEPQDFMRFKIKHPALFPTPRS